MAVENRLRLRRFVIAPLVLLLVALATPSATTAHGPGLVLKRWGTATVDGVMAPGEWDRAAHVDFPVTVPGGGSTTATFYEMNDATKVYGAFLLRGGAQSGLPVEDAWILIDREHNGDWGNGDDRLSASTVFPSDSFDQVVRKPCPEYNAIWCTTLDTANGGTADVTARVGSSAAGWFYELSHPLRSGDPNDMAAVSVGGRVGAQVGISLCTSTCGGGAWPSAGASGWADIVFAAGTPTLALEYARFETQWARSELVGSLVIRGSVSDQSTLLVTATPSDQRVEPLEYSFLAGEGAFEQRGTCRETCSRARTRYD
jgi:hypothetical protein